MRRLGSLRFLLLAGLVAGFDVSVIAAQGVRPGTIFGTIVSRENGQVVPESVVTIESTGLTAVTNAIGRFQIDNVPPGEVALIVRGPGFLELRLSRVQVRSNETLVLTVELDVSSDLMERVQVTAYQGAAKHRGGGSAGGYRGSSYD